MVKHLHHHMVLDKQYRIMLMSLWVEFFPIQLYCSGKHDLCGILLWRHCAIRKMYIFCSCFLIHCIFHNVFKNVVNKLRTEFIAGAVHINGVTYTALEGLHGFIWTGAFGYHFGGLIVVRMFRKCCLLNSKMKCLHCQILHHFSHSGEMLKISMSYMVYT